MRVQHPSPWVRVGHCSFSLVICYDVCACLVLAVFLFSFDLSQKCLKSLFCPMCLHTSPKLLGNHELCKHWFKMLCISERSQKVCSRDKNEHKFELPSLFIKACDIHINIAIFSLHVLVIKTFRITKI